jgi:hypothetical protein
VKLQCDLCREIVVADFAVDGDAIRVRCPACDGSFRVAATAASAATAGPSVPAPPAPTPPATTGPTLTCPKCGSTQAPADACRSCGLRVDRMDDYAAQRPVDGAPTMIAAWADAQAAWTDPAVHDRLANLAPAHHAAAWLARRYRDHLRASPGDAIAADRIARIARISEAALRASATPRGDKSAIGLAVGSTSAKPYRGVLTILIVLVMVIVAGTIYAIASTPSAPPDVPPIPITPPTPHH